ncbi:hypothetical protein AYI69_g1605 [Smittium culicis]|uniref:Uncharacterized protein n=1 Tax=Smittium culicis TaxID=133412 RepID=A0A1R1YPU0_9FUNG|nr:hypothetical protein AYI69_g1605 [Smittium culicis]
MSAVRCYSLQKVADDATRIAMNVGKSTAMNRLRTELSIAQINTKSSIARERACHKWSSSRTWISDLINNLMLNRKVTWVTWYKRWSERFNKNLMRGLTKKTLYYRALKNDKSMISQWMRKVNGGNQSNWMGLELKYS